MGNSLAGGKYKNKKKKKKKRTKVMKISGETLKLKTPVTAAEVVKDYPGHVVLESEAVKHFGVRARPLEGHQTLEPRRLYFLVELPKAKDESIPRRVRSGIQMSAQDRLESLILSRRSASDLSIMKSTEIEDDNGKVRVKMRLPKADVERLFKESESQAEAAAKIMDLCLLDKKQQPHWPWDPHAAAANNISTHVVAGGEGFKSSKKRVSFVPIKEVNQISVAS